MKVSNCNPKSAAGVLLRWGRQWAVVDATLGELLAVLLLPVLIEAGAKARSVPANSVWCFSFHPYETSHYRKHSPKWYQRPVSEFFDQGLQFALSTLLAFVKRTQARWKNLLALVFSVIIPLLVIACHREAMARLASGQPPHLKEIFEELLSIRIPTGKVVPNHADTGPLHVKYTQNDTWTVCLLDIASRKSRLVREVINGEGVSKYLVQHTVAIRGWPPHDGYFAWVSRHFHSGKVLTT
jgi:hypothetical protein